MIIKRQYLDYEKSNGFIMTKVLNPSYANDTIPFDVFEAVQNPGAREGLHEDLHLLCFLLCKFLL